MNVTPSTNGLVFNNTSHRPLPLLSTQAMAPGIRAFTYGKFKMSLAWATRIVCKLKAIPVVLVMVFVMVNCIAMEVNVVVANTRYTPFTAGSRYLTMTTSPTDNPGG